MDKVVFTGQRLFMKFAELGYFEKRLKEMGLRAVHVREPDDGPLKNELRKAVAVVLIARTLNEELIGEMSRCRLILTLSVGYDCVDVAAATRSGIPVCNTPAYCTDEVANHAMTLLLGVARKLPLILPRTRQAVWDYAFTKPIFNFRDKTLGIIGLGRVGRALVAKARGFAMSVCAYDPYVHDDIFGLLGVERCYELEDLLGRSDYVSIHAPLTPETYHMFAGPTLAQMRKHSVLVNTARGAIIDQSALCAALDEGRIGGAGLDVLEVEPPAPDDPLLQREDVIITPHVAWYSEESFHADMVDGMDELERVLSGRRPRFIVNPEVLGGKK